MVLPLRYRQRAIVLAAVKDKPFGWPRKARPSLTATRHDGAGQLRSGGKNGSAGVKQKNGYGSRFRAKILSSRYARAAINFPGTKNRNNRGFPHQIPWLCSTIISFRVGAEDAPYMEQEFGERFDQFDLTQLRNHHIYLKLMIDG